MNEQKNLLLAIVVSLLILLIFQYFFPTNKEDIYTKEESKNLEMGKEIFVQNNKKREEIINEQERVFFSKDSRLKGSISLKGLRFDDIILKDYNETVDKESELISILSPKETKNAYFADFGWMTSQNIDIPREDTVWEIVSGDQLGPNRPIVFKWTSPDNVVFVREVSLDKNFLFSIKQTVINNSKSTINVTPYGRLNRKGTPETSGFYILHEGPIGVLNERLLEIDYDDLFDKNITRTSSIGGWLGITDKYWLAALIPNQENSIEAGFKATRNNFSRYQADYTGPSYQIDKGQETSFMTNLFVGAKEVKLLDSYADKLAIIMFDRSVDFGWFYVITKPLFLLLHWFSGIFGNVGLSILALTVVIRIILFPLANKSFKSMSKMKLLSPKMQDIRERFKNDKMRMQQEIMTLYKSEKVNPLSGCLPILIQIPIFFALYKVLFVTLETRHEPFYGWIKDLSAPDPTTIFNVFGLFSFTPPSFLMIGAWPLLMAFTMYLQQKLNPAPPDPLQAKIMSFLPLVFLFLFATFPAGLVIYWTWNNILSIGQQWIIMRKKN
tara:strand:- start:641 stop:2302 length:1662 start_codon:yes stop_codon:yes gene_type:complete